MITLEYELRKTKILSKFIPLKEWFESREYRNYDHGRTQGLAWNIKVWNNDETGHSGSEKLNSKYDKLWDKYLKDTPEFFGWCCEDGLGFVGKKFRQYNWNEGIPGIECCDYELVQAGRSGGWLILERFANVDLFQYKDDIELLLTILQEDEDKIDIEDLCETLANIEDLSDSLTALKIFCESLDKFDATKEWNHQCNFRRYNLECDWDNKDFSCFDANHLVELYEDDEIDDSIKKNIFDYWNRNYQLKLPI